MKAVVPLVLCLLGVATAASIEVRDSYDAKKDPSYPTDDKKAYPTDDKKNPGYPTDDKKDDGYPTDDKKDDGYPTDDKKDDGYPTDDKDYGDDKGDDWGKPKPWKPLTKDPHFFKIEVDDYCSYDDVGTVPQPGGNQPVEKRQAVVGGNDDLNYCPLRDYAIRLEKGSVIATPYNKYYDSDLPTFFVDDDTQLYTVSKEPLQVYVDAVTGALQYTKVGWLPPNAISIGFYHTGNNPLGVLHPSSAFLTWPSTFNTPAGGNFLLCPLGQTRQYKIYVDFANFYPQGVVIDSSYCSLEHLAAINANPWKQSPKGGPGYGQGGYGQGGYGQGSYGQGGYDQGQGQDGGYGKA